MKKKIFSYLLALITCGVFAQTRVIENPAYEVKNSGLTTITKIECTDTETKVYLHYTFLPKWWTIFSKDEYLEDCDTGKKYAIKKVVNTPFGKKIKMPMSGVKDFVIIYEPLDKSVTKINYNKFIFGVSLSKKHKEIKQTKIPKSVKKWFKKELSKVKTPPLKDFNSPEFFTRKNAKLIGYIKGYDPRLDFKTGITYIGNVITREDYPIVIEIYEDGRFEAELPLSYPIHAYFTMANKGFFNYYLEPGQTLAMVVDWDEFLLADRFRSSRHTFKNIEFFGPLAKINQDLLAYKKEEFDYQTYQNQKKELTPKKFKKAQNKKYHKGRNTLLKHIVMCKNLDEKSVELLTNMHVLENAYIMLDFLGNRDYYAKQDTLNKALKAPVPDKYYDFLQEIDLNDQSLLISNKFSSFINRFEYCDPLKKRPKPKTKKAANDKTFVEYLHQHKIVISTEHETLLTNYEKLDGSERKKNYQNNKEKLDKINQKYNKEKKAFYKEKFPYKPSIDKWTLRDSILNNELNLQKNMVYDIAKIRDLKFTIRDAEKKYADEYWNSLKKEIQHPFLKQEGDRVLAKTYPSEQEKTAYKLPQGTATDIFNKIITPHKGKILFVDFWATTCAPCVGGIKRMKETREKYKDNKDFEFVFITNEKSSPQKAYNKLVEEQNLTNTYRISSDEFNYLRQLFKFNGIPHYAVIDKNGNVINDDFRMYQFKRELDRILEANN